MKVFVDAGYYIARTMPRDQWHRQAVKAVAPGMEFYTSSLVINETVTRLQRLGLFSSALAFLQQIRSSDSVHIVHPDATLQAEGWDLLGKWGGSGANAVDCVSFAIMHRFGIRKAFSFDAHFRKAGFEILKP